MAAVLQLGSVDFASGLCIGVASSVVEVCVKRCLLSGETCLQRCVRHARESVLGHGEGSPLRATLGVVPVDADGDLRGAHAGNEEQPRLAAAKAQELREDLLAVVVIYSNMMEAVAHALVFVWLIFAKVNANEGNAPLTPHTQIFYLFVSKMAIEVLTDIFLYASSCRTQGDVASNVYTWDRLSREGRVAVGFLSAIMASDLVTWHILKLCPYAVKGGTEALAVGLCE